MVSKLIGNHKLIDYLGNAQWCCFLAFLAPATFFPLAAFFCKLSDYYWTSSSSSESSVSSSSSSASLSSSSDSSSDSSSSSAYCLALCWARYWAGMLAVQTSEVVWVLAAAAFSIFSYLSCWSPTLAARSALANLSASASLAFSSGRAFMKSSAAASTFTSFSVVALGAGILVLATTALAEASASSAVGASSPTSVWEAAAFFLRALAELTAL